MRLPISTRLKQKLTDRTFVSKFPIVLTGGIEGVASLSQIARMWQAQSAVGQSLFAWVLVTLALSGWLWWHLVITPEEKSAIRACALVLVLNVMVIFTVVYFRYWSLP